MKSGCSVYWRLHRGDIMSTLDDVQYIGGDIVNCVWRYTQYLTGTIQYIGQISRVHWGIP